jgi:hypothetical protein
MLTRKQYLALKALIKCGEAKLREDAVGANSYKAGVNFPSFENAAKRYDKLKEHIEEVERMVLEYEQHQGKNRKQDNTIPEQGQRQFDL